MPSAETESVEEPGWTWDPSLYAGSARYYSVGRTAYPAALTNVLVAALQLDGTGRLVDVGCGPGSLTLLLAPHFAEVIGVDADADMLAEAARLAEQGSVRNVSWRHLRGEDLPADVPEATVVTFAQSFHWMDRPRVASAVRDMLAPGGALVHVHATTHEGVDGDAALPGPRPPRAEIGQLLQRCLGPVQRAGQGVRATGTPGEEASIVAAAGFVTPMRLEVPGRIVERTTEEVVASVYSLSYAAPHLFGDRFDAFDAELRQLLAAASPSGSFGEQMLPIELDLWR